MEMDQKSGAAIRSAATRGSLPISGCFFSLAVVGPKEIRHGLANLFQALRIRAHVSIKDYVDEAREAWRF
jgi:hypothetical protein